MRGESLHASFGGRGPPGKSALRKPLVAEPEPRAVICEHLLRVALRLRKTKTVPAKGSC